MENVDNMENENQVKKRSKLLKRLLIVIAALVVLWVIISIVSSTQMNAAEITFGEDRIPTLQAVVGDRKVIGVSTEKTGGITIKTRTYQAESDKEDTLSTSDIRTYMEKLEQDGFLITKDFGITSPTAQMVTHSKDIGQIISIDIEYDPLRETAVLTYTKGKGIINR